MPVVVPCFEQSGRRLCSGRLGITRATVPGFRHRGSLADRRAVLDAGNRLRNRRGRFDQARLRRSGVLDHLRTVGTRPHGPHRMDSRRVAQPQGQSAARQSPKPDARLQHRSELSALGGDVCGSSGEAISTFGRVTGSSISTVFQSLVVSSACLRPANATGPPVFN